MQAVIVVAAGRGERLGLNQNKCFYPLGDKLIVQHSVETFLSFPEFGRVVLVVGQGELALAESLFSDARLTVVCGGATRSESVWRGLVAMMQEPVERVWIHDGARPFIKRAWLGQLLDTPGDALVPGIPIKDTVKQVADGRVQCTLARETLVAVQTPQIFAFCSLKAMYEKVLGQSLLDDAQVWEQSGQEVIVVAGDEDNLKITTPNDLLLASWRIQEGWER